MEVILSIDAGTTGVRSLLVDKSGIIVESSYREFPQYFPEAGQVEHQQRAVRLEAAGKRRNARVAHRVEANAEGLQLRMRPSKPCQCECECAAAHARARTCECECGCEAQQHMAEQH